MFPSLPMNCQTSLSDSSKALYYRIFETKFEFEEYFNIWNIGDAIRLCRCRTNNHYLRIETGRWRNIDRGNRYCKLCNCQKLGDEYQVCFRVFLFKRLTQAASSKIFYEKTFVNFFELLSTKKQSLLRKLCIFIKHINKVFCTPGLPTVVP